MSNMKPREKMLFAATVAAAMIFVIWQFVLEGGDTAAPGTGGAGGDVTVLERRFQDNLRALEEIYLIESEFSRIGELPSTDEDTGAPVSRPATAFQQQVAAMARENNFPNASPRTDTEEIRGVEDYELINVGITFEGPFEQCMGLLKTFESAGLMMRELSVRSTRDRDYLRVDAVVSRIAERPRGTTDTIDRLRRR